MKHPSRVRNRRRPGLDQAGFTLTELLVALIISAVIMGGLFTSMFDVQRSWRVSRNQVENGRNERAGVEMMVRDIRMAGSGFGGAPITTGGVVGNTVYSLEPKPGSFSNPDTLTITASFTGLSAVTTANMGSPSDPIVIDDITGFEVDDLVVVTDGIQANMFQVTSISGGNTLLHSSVVGTNDPTAHGSLWPTGGYATGTTVTQVRRVSYWIDDSTDPPRLLRRLDAGQVLPVSTAAFGLNLDYQMADGTLDPDPADPSLVRGVLLKYVPTAVKGPNQQGYPSTAGDTLQVRIQPRVLG